MKKVRERAGKKTLLDWDVCGGGTEGGTEEEGRKWGTKTKRKRGNKRILIRNLKNNIIRQPDSKCQLREGTRWRRKQRVRQRDRKKGRGRGGKKGEKKHPEWDRWGWSYGDTSPSPLPPHGRNTIFVMLRSNTSPGKIFPVSHWRETDLPGQAGESSYESVYVCAYICVLPH